MVRGRPPKAPNTQLGAALQAHRAALGVTQRQAAPQLPIDRATLARIERGSHAPSLDTALALAKWLGWSVEQVIEAARAPADDQAPPTAGDAPRQSDGTRRSYDFTDGERGKHTLSPGEVEELLGAPPGDDQAR